MHNDEIEKLNNLSLEYSKIKDQKLITSILKILKPVIRMHVSKYAKPSNRKDLEQESSIALIYALDTYDPSKENFLYWANMYIKTRVYRQARTNTVVRIPVSAKDIKNRHIYSFFEQIDEEELNEERRTFWSVSLPTLNLDPTDEFPTNDGYRHFRNF